MRAPILGATVDDLEQLRELVAASSRVTHSDPRAEQGAMVVALAAREARNARHASPVNFLANFEQLLPQDHPHELLELLHRAAKSATQGESTPDFAAAIGLARGVSGYVNHTVPVALHAWWSHPRDFRAAVEAVIHCGGDTDTTAAIVGGIVGTTVGRQGIPPEWIGQLCEWPRSIGWLEQLASQLSEMGAAKPTGGAPELPVLALLARNALFTSIVVTHVLRRMLPPY